MAVQEDDMMERCNYAMMDRAAPMMKLARAASNDSLGAPLSCESPQRLTNNDDADDAPIDDLQGLGIDADRAEEESKQAVEQHV